MKGDTKSKKTKKESEQNARERVHVNDENRDTRVKVY